MAINWWTLGFQTVNVLILIWLLQHFFWRPVSAMIELRRTTVQKGLDDAEAIRTKAAAALAEVDKTRAGFAGERDKVLADARKTAADAHAAALDDAGKQAAALLAAAKADIAKDEADAGQAWAGRSSKLAVDIAGRLAHRLDGPGVQAAFLDWLVTAIQALPPDQRHAVSGGSALEAVSAAALSPADQARTGALIGKAFGSGGALPHIAFKVDPALIAGLELHGDHFTVGNSWRADLAAILADAGHAA